MRSAIAATILVLLCPLHALAEVPALDDLPFMVQVRESVNFGDDPKPEFLLKTAMEVIEGFETGSSWMGGAYEPAMLMRILAVSVAAEQALQAGAKPEDADAALVVGTLLLSVMEDSYWAVVAMDQMGVPISQQASSPEVAASYTKTIAMIPKFAAARIEGLVADALKRNPKNIKVLDAAATYYGRRLDTKRSMKYFKALLPLSDDPRHHFAAANIASYEQSKPEFIKALQALLKRFPEQRWRVSGLLRRQEVTQRYLASRKAPTSVQDYVALSDAATECFGRGARQSWVVVTEGETAHPSAGDMTVARGKWFLHLGLNELAAQVMDEADRRGQTVADSQSIGWRLALRFTQLYIQVSGLQLDGVRDILDEIDADRARLKPSDPFPTAMLGMYTELMRELLDDSVFMAELAKVPTQGFSDEAIARVAAVADKAVSKTKRKFKHRAAWWKLRIMVNVLKNPKEAPKQIGATLAAMDKAVARDQRALSDMFGALVHIVVGRGGDRAILEKARARITEAIERMNAYDKTLAADTALKMDECPPEGCIERSRAWSYLGGVRNMLAAGVDDETRGDWDQETVALMRRGERQLRVREDRWSSAMVQLITHRCIALARQGSSDARQCFSDLIEWHGSADTVRHIWASLVSSDTSRRAEATRTFEEIAKNTNAASGLRYDALKWLLFFKVSDGKADEAKAVAKQAVEVRGSVTALGQSTKFSSVVSSGSFNLNVGMDASKGLVHFVMADLDMWSLMESPVDDDRIDAFLAAE